MSLLLYSFITFWSPQRFLFSLESRLLLDSRYSKKSKIFYEKSELKVKIHIQLDLMFVIWDERNFHQNC